VRVLIVDDSAFMRKVIKEMVLSEGSNEVVGTARDGVEGVAKAIELKPDLITMDIEMPRMNGIEALTEILRKCKGNAPAVLMCSSLTIDGSIEALKALSIGAADFIAKDPQVVGQNDPDFKRQLLAKIRAIGGHRRRLLNHSTSGATKSLPIKKTKVPNGLCTSFEDWTKPEHIDAIVVGSSTGGPPILETIFSGLPASLPVPILVAQHMPELFTRSLAQRLDGISSCGTVLAEHGTCLNEPNIYIALGGKHIKPTRVAGKKIITRLIDEIDGALYKPSVDMLFSTVANLFGPRVLAIQLTGMGEDGAIGAKKICDMGGHVIAQEESSCVVYGMPKAVVENGAANTILSPEDIHQVLHCVCNTTSSSGVHAPQSNRMSA